MAAKPVSRGIDRRFEMIAPEVRVYVVDGGKVRDRLDANFIGGGHDYVYKYVPANEIWLDSGLRTYRDRIMVFGHEWIERMLMKYAKQTYDQAHDLATMFETRLRHGHDPVEEFTDMLTFWLKLPKESARALALEVSRPFHRI